MQSRATIGHPQGGFQGIYRRSPGLPNKDLSPAERQSHNTSQIIENQGNIDHNFFILPFVKHLSLVV